MYEVKLTCTISLPGRIMYSKSESQTRIKTPLLIKRGKSTGKQVVNTKGEPVFVWTKGPDPYKHDSFDITLGNDGNEETYTVQTRKCKPAQKVVRISDAAYWEMITKVPAKFRAPKGYKFDKKNLSDTDKEDYSNKSFADIACWKAMTKEEKVEWHLKQFAKDEGGYLIDYVIFKD